MISEIKTDDLPFLLALSKIPSLGPQRTQLLLRHFSDFAEVWQASQSALAAAELPGQVIAEFLRLRPEISPQGELEKTRSEGVKIICWLEKDYPRLLKEIYYPPFLLFYRGALPDESEFLLAVVGTRKASSYGKTATASLVSALAAAGITIVSGLAFGIDALAHATAISSGGKTIAVLGSGVDKKTVYPAANRYLAEKIVGEGGCVLSEHPVGAVALRHHFPRRNRLISGLSLGTLVIEAPAKSGALITAFHALEQNREVLAVPGNIYSPNSEGANNLLKMGARLVTSAEDVLEALHLKEAVNFIASRQIIPETPEEEKILQQLSGEPKHIDELTRLTQLPIGALNASLSVMLLQGKVREITAGQYIKGAG